MIDTYSVKILLGIMGYLLLLPIAIVVLLADGKTWKNDFGLIFAPVDVFIIAIKGRKTNSLSRQVLIGLLSVSAFAGIIGLLGVTKVLDKALSSFAGVIALSLCSVPGLLLVLIPIAKDYFIRRQNLKRDGERLNAWKKRQMETITGEEFVEILLDYKTIDYVHKFVETVSQQGILQKGQASEQSIKQAIQTIEATHGERQRASTIDDMCILLERIQKSA
ncbi:MAG: hypothetical protein ACOYYJ_15645 [Chloroflexota bacterium]